jgi:hypothetical protein
LTHLSSALCSRLLRFAALGKIAQLVEQLTENQRVPGSIPGLATTFKSRNPFVGCGFFSVLKDCGNWNNRNKTHGRKLPHPSSDSAITVVSMNGPTLPARPT